MGRLINIPLRYCEICGKQIPRNTKQGESRIQPKQYIKSRFCSKKCKGVHHSVIMSGKNNPNYAGGHTKCSDCGKDLNYRFNVEYKKRCRDCYDNFSVKENSSNWKGGKSNWREVISRTEQYKSWRDDVFERDGYTCQECGDAKGGNLQAHHIKPVFKYPDLLLEISNGITLCKMCHRKINHFKL